MFTVDRNVSKESHFLFFSERTAYGIQSKSAQLTTDERIISFFPYEVLRIKDVISSLYRSTLCQNSILQLACTLFVRSRFSLECPLSVGQEVYVDHFRLGTISFPKRRFTNQGKILRSNSRYFDDSVLRTVILFASAEGGSYDVLMVSLKVQWVLGL